MRRCAGDGRGHRCGGDLGCLTCRRVIATFIRLIAHVETIDETVADTSLVQALARWILGGNIAHELTARCWCRCGTALFVRSIVAVLFTIAKLRLRNALLNVRN